MYRRKRDHELSPRKICCHSQKQRRNSPRRRSSCPCTRGARCRRSWAQRRHFATTDHRISKGKRKCKLENWFFCETFGISRFFWNANKLDVWRRRSRNEDGTRKICTFAAWINWSQGRADPHHACPISSKENSKASKFSRFISLPKGKIQVGRRRRTKNKLRKWKTCPWTTLGLLQMANMFVPFRHLQPPCSAASRPWSGWTRLQTPPPPRPPPPPGSGCRGRHPLRGPCRRSASASGCSQDAACQPTRGGDLQQICN